MTSLVSIYGISSSSCGYCHGSTESRSTFSMRGHQLTVGDYQKLIDRGWRRSGNYLYIPNNKEICCPQYPIRLNVKNFQIDKKQKAVLSKLNRFLLTGKRSNSTQKPDYGDYPENDVDDDENTMQTESSQKTTEKEKKKDEDPVCKELEECSWKVLTHCIESNQLPASIRTLVVQRDNNNQKDKKNQPKQIQIRVIKNTEPERKKRGDFSLSWIIPVFHLYKKQLTTCEIKNLENTPDHQVAIGSAEELSKIILQNWPKDPRFTLTAQAGFVNLTLTHRDDHHETPPSIDSQQKPGLHPQQKQQQPLEISPSKPAHTLQIQTLPNSFREEAFELYAKYQTTVHQDTADEVTREGYQRFLCTNPFIPEAESARPLESNPTPEWSALINWRDIWKETNFPGFGAYHQEYRLDGKLIAVGVVDLLPSCLSSVYFFWDPEYHFLSLGVLSALFEIYYVQSFLTRRFAYYYMGYYIHSCPKMRYKGQYKPSHLLCPETHQWVDLEEAVQSVLSHAPYGRFADPSLPVQRKTPSTLNSRISFYSRKSKQVFPITAMKIPAAFAEELLQWEKYVGSDLAASMPIQF